MDELTTKVELDAELPEPPTFQLRNPERAAERAKKSGYYGMMYAAEYQWNNRKCTREAYGDTLPRDGHHTRSIKGRPRRSLKFYTTWMNVDDAKACIQEIGKYNRFTPDAVCRALDALDAAMQIVVGREGSPAIYVWTDDAPAVMDAFRNLTDEPGELMQERYPDHRPRCVAPDELGAVKDAETYPAVTVGEPASEVDAGEPTLVRAFWD